MIPNQWLDYTSHNHDDIKDALSRCAYNPKSEDMFKVLELCNPELVKVIIVGLSPYPKLLDCSGIAFATPDKREYNDLPYSLKVLTWALYKEYNIDRNVEHPLDSRLLHWVKQGVLLYNIALTTIPNDPLSHVSLWHNFSKTLLTNLKQSNPDIIVWTLGSQAKNIIQGNYHSIHPAAMAYNKGLKFDSYFKQIGDDYYQLYSRPLDWFLKTEEIWD